MRGMDKFILLSDIHGNLEALKSVVGDFTEKYNPDGIILLGDILNYGMRPNEVVDFLAGIDVPICVNIYGNHEKALADNDTTRFSTGRGVQLLEYTRSMLSKTTQEYAYLNMESSGKKELEIAGHKVLATHGNIHDPYWGRIDEEELSNPDYGLFDYVLSGHSHIPHFIERFYTVERPEYRNKKRTVFINPGSVGQPRNHNSRAQYAFVDFREEIFHFNSVEYDIAFEQSLYPPELDKFYSKRLSNGI